MYSIKNGFIYFTLLIVILSMSTPEVDGRRLVLRGRRTITRHYYSGMAIPAWLVIVLVAVGEVVIGIAIYFALHKIVLSKSDEPSNSYQPALLEDSA